MKTVVILIHGSKEHSGRYKEFISHLNENNIEVMTGDLADHGQNFNGYFHNFTFNEMLNSALKIIDKAKEEYPNHKHIIMGHSMGSFIVKYILYKNMRMFDATILSGTNHPSQILLDTAMFLSSRSEQNEVSSTNEHLCYGMLSIKSKFKRYGENWLSTDIENEIRYKNDPYCGNDFSSGSLYSMYRFIDLSKRELTLKNFKSKEIPQLIIYGKKDPVSSFGKEIRKMIKFHNKFEINNHQTICYENSKHEILFDVEKEKVVDDILSFITNLD